MQKKRRNECPFEHPVGCTASDNYAEAVLAYMDEHPGDLKPEITAEISSQLSRQVRTNQWGGLIYSGYAVGASNIMSDRSARNELIARVFSTAPGVPLVNIPPAWSSKCSSHMIESRLC